MTHIELPLPFDHAELSAPMLDLLGRKQRLQYLAHLGTDHLTLRRSVRKPTTVDHGDDPATSPDAELQALSGRACVDELRGRPELADWAEYHRVRYGW